MTPFSSPDTAYEATDRCQFAHVDNLWMNPVRIGTDVWETDWTVDNSR
ncbi:hypothetical protein RN50_01634 [Microbacterium foliorum]|uniref:Uncharacterized protein n=1 Tax=Microbacterium foliorum TaxID=104336 RepID=A0A0F0KR93_9MICO|nr:hypothetical protein RN50_01634 [Microbacterium foliorum]